MPAVPQEAHMAICLQFMQTLVTGCLAHANTFQTGDAPPDELITAHMPKPEVIARYAFELFTAAIKEANREHVEVVSGGALANPFGPTNRRR